MGVTCLMLSTAIVLSILHLAFGPSSHWTRWLFAQLIAAGVASPFDQSTTWGDIEGPETAPFVPHAQPSPPAKFISVDDDITQTQGPNQHRVAPAIALPLLTRFPSNSSARSVTL